MQDSHRQLNHRFKLVSVGQNYTDFIDLLTEQINQVSDVRTNIGENDSKEIRMAIVTYLQNTIDTIRRIRKNETARLSRPPQTADDVY